MNKMMLVKLAETYAAHRGLKLSTISTYAVNDGKFFGSLKGVAGCTLARADHALGWFADNWPDDLEWPREIPRPKSTSRKEVA